MYLNCSDCKLLILMHLQRCVHVPIIFMTPYFVFGCNNIHVLKGILVMWILVSLSKNKKNYFFFKCRLLSEVTQQQA